MGLFGKLFEKKVCDICGGEIGLLGNRKLEDGNMCKECASKLSPWFSDRRESTIAEINEQLEYREANKDKVAQFRTTRTYGENLKILLDEDAGRFMVTAERNLKEANPDVLEFSDVTGCELDVDDEEREITRTDKDGNEISYNPPRYTYYYDFYVVIHVRNPYFDEIRVKLNGSRLEIEDRSGAARAPRAPRAPRAGGGLDRFGAAAGSAVVSGIMGALAAGNAFVPENDPEYRRYLSMAEEIKAALLQIRQDARDEIAAAAAPKAAVTCPYCGATTTLDASGCCEFCGGAVNA